ncbi:hypothetical protein B0I35DRAFT_473974 [Stachybotrys elegans]|uniref:Major facilitator superfamily (MFS) profile domain-containing protein n=1 Tax=Stachybotrys elegans TaxID=80388 RepID=A0A8K0T362_9HYPO|nr:hypothetical protein B0I35DRAFT_473974 [Stachybotrys elegans]
MTFSLFQYLPFSSSTTRLQGWTYLGGIALFSIAFLVFLNSSVSFVVTDLIGQKKGVGNVVGTLGFVDEIVVLVACPAWGLLSDRIGVRNVAVTGYTIIAASLAVFVQARNVYPELVLARIFFAVGASAVATMVTAIIPSLTNEDNSHSEGPAKNKRFGTQRLSVAFSVESEATITPERYCQTANGTSSPEVKAGDSSTLAGLVGLFTGLGALVALSLFLPLPTQFGEIEGVTPGQAISYSFYVVGAIALLIALVVAIGLRNLRGEEGKGWKNLLGHKSHCDDALEADGTASQRMVPWLKQLRSAILLGGTDSRIALGYLGGAVARASSVAISLYIPLYVNTFFMDRGFCQGSPNDPSSELKEECRTAYILSSILTGVAQLMALLCAPLFGYLSSRTGRINYPVAVGAVFGVIGYIILPNMSSPEIKDVDGRGGTPIIFLVVSLIGISQIAAIVCSLGSLSRGLIETEPKSPLVGQQTSVAPDQEEIGEDEPLLRTAIDGQEISRIQLKGACAGIYSLCGGAAILLLTKLGGYMFDKVSNGAPFYMMAALNCILLAVSLLLDASAAFTRT